MKLVPLNATVKPYGKVGMIGCLSGERYYWLTKKNYIAMMPASVIEPMYNEQQLERDLSQ